MPPVFDAGYYERSYGSYDRQNPPRKLAFYRRLVEGVVGDAERPRVLDVGCAFGRFLGALDPGWQRHGIDPIGSAVERARRAVPGATFAVASAERIPFAGPFDAIVAFDVLEHIPDLEAVRAELRAHLAPRGHLVLVVPVYDGPLGPLVRLLDGDPTHLHKRSRAFWLDWARPEFDVVDWLGVVRYLLPGGVYLHQPTRAGRRFAPAIAVVARRAS